MFFFIIAACGDNGPSVGPGDPYVGTWELEVRAAPGCWDAFALQFTIDQDDADFGNERVMNVVSRWWEASEPKPADPRNPLSGNLNWERDDFTLLFWKIFGRGDFHGTATGSGSSLSGAFDDPDGVFAHLDPGTTQGCTASAAARRI